MRFRNSQSLLFCSAHSERSEHKNDSHPTRIPREPTNKSEWNDDNARDQALVSEQSRRRSKVSTANNPGPRIRISSAANQ